MYTPRSGIAGSHGSVFSFLRGVRTVLHVAAAVHIPPTVWEGLSSPHPLQRLLFVDFFDDGHSDWCDAVPVGCLAGPVRIAENCADSGQTPPRYSFG